MDDYTSLIFWYKCSVILPSPNEKDERGKDIKYLTVINYEGEESIEIIPFTDRNREFWESGNYVVMWAKLPQIYDLASPFDNESD